MPMPPNMMNGMRHPLAPPSARYPDTALHPMMPVYSPICRIDSAVARVSLCSSPMIDVADG